MARKRLSPAAMVTQTAAPETKSFAAPPIAQVGAEAATSAALSEMTHVLESARDEGRFLERLPLEAIEADYLIRDRMAADAEDLEALKASLAARGQTTPIEVTKLADGRYGLISGWRRLLALRQLADSASSTGTVLARIVTPETAQAAYVAMVEENEIRVNLTPYERAHVVVRALEEGLFTSEREALQTLYGNVSRSKRSKIGSFVRIARDLGAVLRFPRDLSERQGLALARVLGADPEGADRLRQALEKAAPATADAEADLLARLLDAPAGGSASSAGSEPRTPSAVTPPPARSYQVVHRKEAGKIVISGELVDEDLLAALEAFLAKRAQG